ncbi:MAG: hypothetical protein QM820_00095 [Minicystis sp.]
MSPLLTKARNRFAPLLLLAGGAGAAYFLAPHVPKERTVELRLDDAASVTGVDLAWAPIGNETEAVQGGAWHFAAGKAPAAIAAPVRLPDGRYTLDVTVERGAAHEDFHRVITVGDTDRITVRLR